MTNALFDDIQTRFSDFAQKDYELKVAYLTDHFQRILNDLKDRSNSKFTKRRYSNAKAIH